MKLEQSFEVEAPLEQVWGALIDVERVAPNLPGAAVTGRNDDGTYNGTFTIKIGPTTASYTGKLEMQNIDEGSHSATMYAQGSDRRGQGGATATISSKLTDLGDRTRVEVDTDYHITGRLARFGRGGMIEDISERLLREFAGRLQSSLEGGQPTTKHEAGVADAEPAAEQPEESEQPTSETDMTPAVEAEAEGAARPPTEVAAEAEATGPPQPTDAMPPPMEAGPPPPPPPPPADSAPPVQGLSLVGGVVLSRIKKNPAPLIGAIGVLVLLRLLFRKR
jgi:uncharacterized protein